VAVAEIVAVAAVAAAAGSPAQTLIFKRPGFTRAFFLPGFENGYIPLTEYTGNGIFREMTLPDLYRCLSDQTRLRILNLLKEGPLCVCHIQAILDQSQVRVSKALATMKRLGAVRSTRKGTWMIYELLDPSDLILSRNLESLAAVADVYPFFQSDLKKRRKILEDFCASEGDFPPTVKEAVEPCCS